jgi:hypothetical protein
MHDGDEGTYDEEVDSNTVIGVEWTERDRQTEDHSVEEDTPLLGNKRWHPTGWFQRRRS